jgi:NAD(P)H-dependent FMN reductase
VPRLHIISASTRPSSAGRPLARWIAELAAEHDAFDTRLLDLGEIALPFMDEPEHPEAGVYRHRHTKDWSATIAAGDCFVFVMPMYNGGFSAPLKNAIDYLYQEWQNKPVGLVSYSAGKSGGAPAVEMIQPVLGRVGLRPALRTLSVPAIESYVDEEGRFAPTADLRTRAQAVLDAVADLATTPEAERVSA